MSSNPSAMPSSLQPRARGDGPQKRVDELVRKYRRVSNPSSIMLEVFNNPDSYSILVASLRRHLVLVKCRSPEFEDCQVTIYDRALLILSDYGESPTDPGVLELYLTEFLGIVPIAPVADGKKAVSNHVGLQSILDRAQPTHKDENENAIAPALSSEHGRDQEESPPFDIQVEYGRHFPEPYLYAEEEEEEEEEEKETIPIMEAKQISRPDVRAARLLDVYNQAKEDYLTTKARDGVDSLPAIRFLRDSAENTLRYFHDNGLSHDSVVPDLERTFAVARDKTAQILGGRKRHFDEDAGGRGKRGKTSHVLGARKRHLEGHSKGRRHRGLNSNRRARPIIDSYRPQGHY